MEKVKCSVVMPVYNDIGVIVDIVNKIVRIAPTVEEFIVVDDSSNDGTYERLIKEPFPENAVVKILKTDKNGGPAVARNIGINASTSEYIAFLDSDDDWHSDKLKYQIQAMELHDAYMSGTEHSIVTKDEFTVSSKRAIKDITVSDVKWPWMLFKNPYHTSSVVIRRGVQELAFSSELRFCEDFNLWLKIALDYKAIKIHEGLSYMFKHEYISSGTSLSSQLVKMEVGELLSFIDVMKVIRLYWPQRFLVCIAMVFSVMKFSIRVMKKLVYKVRDLF